MQINPNKLRIHVLDMVYKSQSGHIGGSFSLAEIISYLYSNYAGLVEDNKDKFILSKGHAVPILYAVFYELGLIDSIDDFRKINSALQGHPVHKNLKYLHATTGSLGQGLSIAIGHALAYKMKKQNHKVFCILGDGEMQEGQVWEALMAAPKFKLNNLICFLDHNGSQSDGKINDIMSLGDIREKVTNFGWATWEIDGHSEISFDHIFNSIRSINMEGNNAPIFIVLNTIKGKGVSFMEGMKWHAKAPNREEYLKAKKELDHKINSKGSADYITSS